jgi:hypothetical protein
MATAFSKATLCGIEPRYKEKFDADLQNFIRKTGGNVSTGLTLRRKEALLLALFACCNIDALSAT